MKDSLLQQHYDALKTGKPRAHRCKSCAYVTFPIKTACDACGSFGYEELSLSGNGTLLFASHGVEPLQDPRFEEFAPYLYGHIKLAEGVYIQAMIRGIEGTPEAAQQLYAKLPARVALDVIETADMPVMAFKLV